MKREIDDQLLATLDISDASLAEKELLANVQSMYPKDKSVEFWDGALWALMHFGAAKDTRRSLNTQIIGFTYAVALSYKKALEDSKWEIPE